MQLLAARLADGDVPPEQFEEPVLTMRRFGEPLAGKSTYWSWLGTLYAERAARSESTRDRDLQAAIENWSRAHDLAPFNTLHAVKISDAFAQRNEPDNASRWASVALDVNEHLRLDPLVQLSEGEQRRLRARLPQPPR
jgi:hypothetical protein